MRNDISIPPDESEFTDAPLGAEPEHREVSSAPIPPPSELKADVTLYDHPNLAPGGAGNFWLLAMIGVGLIVVVLVILWIVVGWMR